MGSKLPAELLITVFIFAGITEGNPCTHSSLARVCKAWHSLVYSHPRSWTTLTFTVKTSTPSLRTTRRRATGELSSKRRTPYYKDVGQYLEAWFGRANDDTTPLTLNVIMEPDHSTSILPDLTAFMVKTQRWKALSLSLLCNDEFERNGKWEWLHGLLAAAKKLSRKPRAPCWASLQSFEIRARGIELQCSTRLPLLDVAPNLQHLKIQVHTIKKVEILRELLGIGKAVSLNLHSIEIDAKYIYRLSTHAVSHFWLPTLLRSTQLESFKFIDLTSSFDTWTPHPDSPLPNHVPNSSLRHLSIYDTLAMRSALEHVFLPSLTSLCVYGNDEASGIYEEPKLEGAVKRLIEHSHCEITHLRMINKRTPFEIISLLYLLLHVETLEIIISPFMASRGSDASLAVKEALRDLIYSSRGPGHLLPHLRNFYLKTSGAPGIVEVPVKLFVESPQRWWSDDSNVEAGVTEVGGSGSSTMRGVGGASSEQALPQPRYARLENVRAVRHNSLDEFVSTIYSRGPWEGTEY